MDEHKDGDALRWDCKRFNALSGAEVYALLALRAEVFVVEQNCAYLDPDGLDPVAMHWLAWSGEHLVAHQRCLPPDVPYEESSIGRIVTSPGWRGREIGRELVRRGIDFNRQQWPRHSIRIGAQARLTRFYESFGFRIAGDPYIEDGIEHVHMLLTP